MLLDKLRSVIVDQINNGCLSELKAFVKEGLQAYRLPLPKGEVQEDGSEKILLDDFSYKWRPLLDSDTVCSSKDKVDAYHTCSSLLDDVISDLFE